MNSFNKLCAVLLALVMMLSCFSTTIFTVSAEDTTTEETTPVSITGSALDFLYNQALELDAAYDVVYDIKFDNVVDLKDLVRLKKLCAGIEIID